MQNVYAPPLTGTVAEAAAEKRAAFIRRTYFHLALAIIGFIAMEAWIFAQPWAEGLAARMSGMWLLVIGGFVGVSWLANHWAHNTTSQTLQYVGLCIFVMAEAFIFLPLLWMAREMTGDLALIQKAGMATLGLFLALTVTVFITRKDFSFLRSILVFVGIGAVALVILSIVFGLSLGTWFSVAMVVLAGASILYTTSSIMREYRTDQHVAASLSLFASVALMFYYILRIFMSRD